MALRMRLPNFFLVGAPKAGTTSLYHYLDQHPEIYMSPIKEPCFFSTEIRDEVLDPKLRRRAARDNHDLQGFLAGPMLEKGFGDLVDTGFSGTSGHIDTFDSSLEPKVGGIKWNLSASLSDTNPSQPTVTVTLTHVLSRAQSERKQHGNS